MGILSNLFEFFLSLIKSRRRLRLLVHRGFFSDSYTEYYFIKVTNLSLNREIVITSVWVDCNPNFYVMDPDRPLPLRLKPDDIWETWVKVDSLPREVRENAFNLVRVKISTGKVFKSKQNKDVPEKGYVAGGPCRRHTVVVNKGMENARGLDGPELPTFRQRKIEDKTLKCYGIFIASPDGLSKEREVLREEMRYYNEREGYYRRIHFRPRGWEDIDPEYGRPQGILDKILFECDCYILILSDRWGTPTSTETGWPYSSGSEEEFRLAERCYKDQSLNMVKVAVYFKNVDQARWEKPDEQLKKVKEFKGELEKQKVLFFKEFDGIQEFRRLMGRLFAKWGQCFEEENDEKEKDSKSDK